MKIKKNDFSTLVLEFFLSIQIQWEIENPKIPKSTPPIAETIFWKTI
jgi:hypothetical protein